MAKSAKLPIYAQLIACLRQGRSKPRHFWGNTLSRSLQVELLEKRQLLDASALSSSHVSPDEQIVFLNFDGAQDVLYRGPIEIDGISIASFHEGMPKSIDAHQIVAEIVAELNAAPNMVNQGVHFTTRRPQLAPYSTVYVGAENKQFHKFGSFFGVAERVDIGNQTRTDNAFVFSDKIAASFGSSQATLTNALIHVIDHEVQHLLGFSHEFNVGGVLDEVAYSQDVHQWIAQQGYAYFEKQFGYSSLTDNLHWFVDGADDEDDAGLNPFGHGGVNHPSVRHFWDHDAAFSRTFNDGLLGFDSAPNRAIKYITGGFGLTGIFDTDWGSGPSRPGAGLASLGAASSYAADPATAFYYLGHAAHLLQDMAVPAHVHSDQHLELGGAGLNPDPYHDWVDGAEFSSSVFQNPARIAAFDNIDPDRWTNYALPDEVDTTSMRTASDILAGFIPGSVSPDVRPLYQLFLDTAGLSDNYDSRNANGEIDRGGRGDTGSVFDNNYNNWTRAELEEIARVLVPRSIRDMGDLVRYFYAVVDSGDSGKPQVEQVAIDNLSDADPQQPHGPSNPKLSSDATIILRTAASDDNNGKSGIGKDLFQFEFRTKPPGGAWTDWQSPADETNWPGYTSSNGLALNSSHFQDGANISSLFGGQAGAVAAPVFRGQFGYSYGFRVLAEDGAGNQQMSEERYVKIERDSGVNVIEVIDRSSSMSGEKIEAAKQAASLFVNLMDQGDRIGIVSYSSAARVDYALNEILADGSIQQAANSAIAAIDSSGNTAIGKGILAADTQLDALDPGASRAMIVLTDGIENVSPYALDVIDSDVDSDIRIYTIGFGGDADSALMSQVAAARGGQYFFAPDSATLSQIYAELSGTVTGEQPQFSATGTIASGQALVHQLPVDLTTNQLTVGVTWPGSDLDLELVAPDGRVITHQIASSDPNIHLNAGPTFELLKIDAPQPGTWQLRLLGVDVDSAGEPYELFARIDSPVRGDVLPHPESIMIDRITEVKVALSDGTPIQNAVVYAQIISPDQTTSGQAVLYDDGLHGDDMASDGIYGNGFLLGNTPGDYQVQIAADGIALETIPFTRTPSTNYQVALGSVNGGPRYHVPSGDTPKLILDTDTILSTITLDHNAAIADLNVRVNIEHTYDSDLTAVLIAPSGQRFELFSQVGGSEDDFLNTVFDSDAQDSIALGTAPFTGSYRPTANLDVLGGTDVHGTWTLELSDTVGGDSGRLIDWALSISEIVSQPVDVVLLDGQRELQTGESLDFGVNYSNGEQNFRTLTVRNDGVSTISLGSIVLPAGFSLVDSPYGRVAPGETASFRVVLESTQLGHFSGASQFLAGIEAFIPHVIQLQLSGSVFPPGANPWNNHFNPLDVNHDNFVAPNDALLIINELNRAGARQLPSAPPLNVTPVFIDTGSDGYVAPNDVLLVVNYLNRDSSAPGEGESSLTTPARQTETVDVDLAAIDATSNFLSPICVCNWPRIRPEQAGIIEVFERKPQNNEVSQGTLARTLASEGLEPNLHTLTYPESDVESLATRIVANWNPNVWIFVSTGTCFTSDSELGL